MCTSILKNALLAFQAHKNLVVFKTISIRYIPTTKQEKYPRKDIPENPLMLFRYYKNALKFFLDSVLRLRSVI